MNEDMKRAAAIAIHELSERPQHLDRVVDWNLGEWPVEVLRLKDYRTASCRRRNRAACTRSRTWRRPSGCKRRWARKGG